MEAVQRKLRVELWHTVRASWSFWTPVNSFAWLYLQPHLRVPTGSLAAAVWNIYLSLVEHRES